MLNSDISGWGAQGDVTLGELFLGLKSGLKQMKKINTLLKHYINFLQIVNLSQWFDHSTDVERLQLFCYDGIQIISLFFFDVVIDVIDWIGFKLLTCGLLTSLLTSLSLWTLSNWDIFECQYDWVWNILEQLSRYIVVTVWCLTCRYLLFFLFIFKLKVEQKTHKCANV